MNTSDITKKMRSVMRLTPTTTLCPCFRWTRLNSDWCTYLRTTSNAERCEVNAVNGQCFNNLICQLGAVRDIQVF